MIITQDSTGANKSAERRPSRRSGRCKHFNIILNLVMEQFEESEIKSSNVAQT